MRLHYRAGDRTTALRQFARCSEALGRELGVAPAPQTIALARPGASGRPRCSCASGRARWRAAGRAVQVPRPAPGQPVAGAPTRRADPEHQPVRRQERRYVRRGCGSVERAGRPVHSFHPAPHTLVHRQGLVRRRPTVTPPERGVARPGDPCSERRGSALRPSARADGVHHVLPRGARRAADAAIQARAVGPSMSEPERRTTDRPRAHPPTGPPSSTSWPSSSVSTCWSGCRSGGPVSGRVRGGLRAVYIGEHEPEELLARVVGTPSWATVPLPTEFVERRRSQAGRAVGDHRCPCWRQLRSADPIALGGAGHDLRAEPVRGRCGRGLLATSWTPLRASVRLPP